MKRPALALLRCRVEFSAMPFCLGRHCFKHLFLLVICLIAWATKNHAIAEIISFNQAKIAYQNTMEIPVLGWSNTPIPVTDQPKLITTDRNSYIVVWLKQDFDRKRIGQGDIALSMAQTDSNIQIFINGNLIYKSEQQATDFNFVPFQPMMINLPNTFLKAGENSLVLRLAPEVPTHIMTKGIRVGLVNEIGRHHSWRLFFQFIGPILVTAILAAATLSVFVFWTMRRHEKLLLWLAGIGLVAALASLQGLISNLPFAFASQVLPAMIIGFGATYYKDGRNLIYLMSAVCVAVLCVISSQAMTVDSAIVLTLVALLAVLMIGFFLRQALKVNQIKNYLMLGAAIVSATGLVHDVATYMNITNGLGLPVTPYASLVVFGMFGILIARQFIATLAAKETQNEMLGMRIETTKANLIASEAARRSLEVSNAITSERERMMREIHDGIGSSLMAALASAERQGKQSSTAVIALKSALTDLRIAVDSLEPVEGNVTTLLANLRYRVEPELRKSGIAFEWRVEDVPELEWLDAPNALHILRIFQEALGNILGHANATKITVRCKMAINEGSPGVGIEVQDNGEGFDTTIPPKGRGRKNMQQRAEALGGRLVIQSAPGQGARTMLWLPLLRVSSLPTASI